MIRDLIINGFENLGFFVIRDLIDLGFEALGLTADNAIVTADDTTHTADEV